MNDINCDVSKLKIAYFSAEIGIDEKIKTYSGGLGIFSRRHYKGDGGFESSTLCRNSSI